MPPSFFSSFSSSFFFHSGPLPESLRGATITLFHDATTGDPFDLDKDLVFSRWAKAGESLLAAAGAGFDSKAVPKGGSAKARGNTHKDTDARLSAVLSGLCRVAHRVIVCIDGADRLFDRHGHGGYGSSGIMPGFHGAAFAPKSERGGTGGSQSYPRSGNNTGPNYLSNLAFAPPHESVTRTPLRMVFTESVDSGDVSSGTWGEERLRLDGSGSNGGSSYTTVEAFATSRLPDEKTMKPPPTLAGKMKTSRERSPLSTAQSPRMAGRPP